MRYPVKSGVSLGSQVLFPRRYIPATSLRIRPASCELNRERPHIFTEILFLLLLSGPPMFRGRDPMASLRGEIDAVVVFQLLVWGMAGIWVLIQLDSRRVNGGLLRRLWLPQKLGLGLVLCLGCSALVSPAPLFTAFKVYQMAVLLLFGFLFVKRYGVETCLSRLLLGYSVICVGAILISVVAPSLVLNPSGDMGVSRWRGDLFVPTGTVSMFAFALLLANPPAVSMPAFLIMLGLFSTLLALSQTRSAYIALFVFVVLAILRRPKVTRLRQFLWAMPAAVAILFLAGLMPHITQWIIRDPESVADLSGRAELWSYVSNIVLRKSPLIGLGYCSASRTLSLQFASNMGNAHSAFVEVLVGGGILSFAFLGLLSCVLALYALTLLLRKNDRLSFATSALLPLALVMAAGGWGDFDAGTVALTFWCLAAMLPQLRSQARAGACFGESGANRIDGWYYPQAKIRVTKRLYGETE